MLQLELYVDGVATGSPFTYNILFGVFSIPYPFWENEESFLMKIIWLKAMPQTRNNY